ncbi:MAG: hypothetical protein GH151_02900, partial [Bacteroidetes bacterium]|nr:hypothetical protein [Bacteroidota bacterium]
MEGTDYIRAYYSLDGGPETLLTNGDQTDDFGNITAVAFGLNGSTLAIIIIVNNNANAEYHRFDNVKIFTQPDTRYAIQSGNWDNTNNWSYTSGGASCNCIPDVFSEVHINEAGGGYTINLNTDGETKDLTVYTGGELRWTNDNVELYLNNDGIITVQSGGTINENSRSETKIMFTTDGSDYSIDNEGSFTIDDIELQNNGGSLTINGSGDITITDELDFTDANVGLANNNTGTIYIQDDILFDNNNSELENYGTITVTDDIRNNLFDNDNRITNYVGGTINVGDDLNCSLGRFIIDNYGTIDLNGEFTFIQAGEVQFYNRSGATWYYAGSNTDDDDIQIFCNYDANTFEYDRGDVQDVHVPQDAYWHLTLSNSGTKTTLGNLDINGNLTISGTAEFDIGTNSNNITVAGDWSNSGTFTEGTQTVTFDGNTAQSISNSTGEIFYNLTINNSGSGLTLSDGNATVSNTLTMTQGNVDANSYILTLGTSTAILGTLSHTSGTIIRKFERWINNTGIDILFPVGTSVNENFATINFTNLTGGSLIIEFNPTDPGSTGLPLSENGLNITDQFTEGFWDFTAVNSLASTDYDIDLDANGFTSYTINSASRIIKRTNGGSWILDGTHVAAIPPTCYRVALSGISTLGTQFGIGETDCVSVTTHPTSKTKCTGAQVTFVVAASGQGVLTYQWQKDGIDLSDGGDISGATNNTLTISNVDAADEGDYVCV